MNRTQIAVVDDDEVVRLSIATYLTDAGFDVSLFDSGDSFLAGDASNSFSCILLDVQMPGSDGLAVLRALGEGGDPPPVVVMTAHGDTRVAVAAMKLGAYDFVEKPYVAGDLRGVIDGAVAGRLTSDDARNLRKQAASLVASLTPRQFQVLQGIVRGLQNKNIAYELGISIRTVEAYRGQLLERLGARGTAEAVRLAIAAGITDDGAVAG
jgi:two-component system, LuxR family, response regulator FixJ